MKKSISVIYRIGRFKKGNLSANIGIGRYEKNLIGRTLTNVMHLTFYADGIRLDEGRFRPYAERATKAFMKDLSDGFFPSELQVNYLLTYKYQNMVVGGFQKKWRIDSQSHIF